MSTAVAPLAVIPLYIYPSAGAWQPLINSAKAYPKMNFQAIINPNDGPGSPPYPDSNYVTAIAALNSYSNINTACYVHTSYGARSVSDIEADIQTCAGWASHPGSDIHMDGIFFDEVNNVWNTTTEAYLSTIVSYAKSAIAGSTILFNPGRTCDAGLYSLADHITVFENTYSAFSTSVLSTIPVADRVKSNVIIYQFTGNAASQQKLVNTIVNNGWAGVFITTKTVYSAWSTLWSQFVQAMSTA